MAEESDTDYSFNDEESSGSERTSDDWDTSENENDLLDNPFVLLCEEFIQEFERLLPNDHSRPHGRYEQSIEMAFGRIEALPYVERVTLRNRFTFLISMDDRLAVYTRCVRQEGISVHTYLRVDHFFS